MGGIIGWDNSWYWSSRSDKIWSDSYIVVLGVVVMGVVVGGVVVGGVVVVGVVVGYEAVVGLVFRVW